MKVTGPLIHPKIPPCSTMEDFPQAPVPQQQDMTGWDCCQYYDRGSTLHNDYVRVDQVNPEKFNYNQYRYQLYAKPDTHDCHAEKSLAERKLRSQQINSQPPRYYPATTDVRALQQSMYIPIVPSNPGGETEVTFPMTPRTMGQPDVTSACCVPVIPSQPGYKNLTQGILPGPCAQLNGSHVSCVPAPNQMTYNGMGAAPGGGAGCGPQFVPTPSNVPGTSCLGLPDTFPMKKEMMTSGQRPGPGGCSYTNQRTPIPKLDLPHYTGEVGRVQGDAFDDTMPDKKTCLNSSVFNYKDRVNRAIQHAVETPEQMRARLKTMYGSPGSVLFANQTPKRMGIKIVPDHITLQGNGFQWDYPQNPNRMCYVLERNSRC